MGARIIGTVLNRVKGGPAYFYYPTYAANRVALDSSSAVAALSAGPARRSLVAAPQPPEAQALAEQAAPESSQTTTFSGGLVEPPAEPSEESMQDAERSAQSADEPASPYATAFIDAIAPDMTAVAQAGAADDLELNHAIGEAVAAYSNNDDQPLDTNSTLMHSNGHSSTVHRRSKHR